MPKNKGIKSIQKIKINKKYKNYFFKMIRRNEDIIRQKKLINNILHYLNLNLINKNKYFRKFLISNMKKITNAIASNINAILINLYPIIL